MMPRLLVGVSLTLFGLGIASCGARSGLSTPDGCSSEGAERACQDACGSGSQVCSGGLWSECRAPVATRSCSDDCGSGLESCIDGKWHACEVAPVQRECSSKCATGHETCDRGVWGACDARQAKPPQLKATVRDFSSKHDDFEADYTPQHEQGIVEHTLGADDQPVYVAGHHQTTSTPENFYQWYHDSPVSMTAPLDLQLLPAGDEPGFFIYANDHFFPIDNQLLGNETYNHNYHFTLEANTTFTYLGGEVFSLSGDDDIWVYINRKLAIDLGGLHNRLSGVVSLDKDAATLGLVPGGVYPLHLFFAERHTTKSELTIRTSIAAPGSCD